MGAGLREVVLWGGRARVRFRVFVGVREGAGGACGRTGCERRPEAARAPMYNRADNFNGSTWALWLEYRDMYRVAGKIYFITMQSYRYCVKSISSELFLLKCRV